MQMRSALVVFIWCQESAEYFTPWLPEAVVHCEGKGLL